MTTCWQKECEKRRLAHVGRQAVCALEELAVGIDQRHQRDRRAEEVGDEPCDAVEGLFGGGIEQAGFLQRRQAARIAKDVGGPGLCKIVGGKVVLAGSFWRCRSTLQSADVKPARRRS